MSVTLFGKIKTLPRKYVNNSFSRWKSYLRSSLRARRCDTSMVSIRRGFGGARDDVSSVLRWIVVVFVLANQTLVTGVEPVSSHQSFRLRDVATAAFTESNYVITIRRELHRSPELMWEEFGTSAVIKRELDEMGIEHKDVAAPGVVGQIGNGEGPAVLLRADMDALPIFEESSADFFPTHLQSQTPGIMHACGHDGHVAMLLGAAKILKKHESKLNGTVYLVFQPAEEGGAGARAMLEKGLLKFTPKIQAAFALHNWPYPETKSGVIGTRVGTIMAGSAAFEIKLSEANSSLANSQDEEGKHKNNADTILCAAGVISALQTFASRLVDPLDAALVTVTVVDSSMGSNKSSNASSSSSSESFYSSLPGSEHEFSPKQVRLVGQFHATSPETFQSAFDAIENIATLSAKSLGCDVTVDFSPEVGRSEGRSIKRAHYPPTVNDPKVYELVTRVGVEMFGNSYVLRNVDPVMPGEDFGFFVQTWPSNMAWLGVYSPEKGSVYPLHSGKYVLDESVLHKGVAMHIGVALEFLNTGGGGEGERRLPEREEL